MDKPKCSECYHYEPNVRVSGDYGNCLRFPPTILIMRVPVDSKGMPVTSALQKPSGVAEVPQMHTAMVSGEGRCGEFKPNEATH